MLLGIPLFLKLGQRHVANLICGSCKQFFGLQLTALKIAQSCCEAIGDVYMVTTIVWSYEVPNSFGLNQARCMRQAEAFYKHNTDCIFHSSSITISTET